MSTVREQIADARARDRGQDVRQVRRQVHRLKAQAAADQFANHPGRNMRGELSLPVRGGREVTLTRVELRSYPDGNTAVEIWTGDPAGPPQWRVVNPPTLVEDPAGDVEVAFASRNRTFREDPLAALAQVVAGGAR